MSHYGRGIYATDNVQHNNTPVLFNVHWQRKRLSASWHYIAPPPTHATLCTSSVLLLLKVVDCLDDVAGIVCGAGYIYKTNIAYYLT